MKKSSGLALLLATLSLACLPAQTASGMEERLKALEQQVQGRAKENAELKQQLGWKGAVAPVPP